jgi:hypothetical protein
MQGEETVIALEDLIALVRVLMKEFEFESSWVRKL